MKRLPRKTRPAEKLRKRVYRITMGEDGRWEITRDDVEEVLAYRITKESAVEQAVAWARKKSQSQVVLYKEDGTIETEYSYGVETLRPKKKK